MNQNKKIISLLKKSIKIEPNFSKSHSAIAEIFLNKKEYNKAFKYINTAIKIERNKIILINKEIERNNKIRKFYSIRELSENLKNNLFSLSEYLLKKSEILIVQNKNELAIRC